MIDNKARHAKVPLCLLPDGLSPSSPKAADAGVGEVIELLIVSFAPTQSDLVLFHLSNRLS